MTVAALTSFFQLDEQNPDELPAMRQALGNANVVELIQELPKDSIVFPRFRALPFGDFLEREIALQGSRLINTYRQHRNIADSSTWAHLLDGTDGQRALSPRQYTLADIPCLPEGEWFVKGETNSLKNRWLEASYAPTTKDLTRVTSAFLADAWMGSQSVVIKPFQRYRQLATALNSQPIFHERRVFVLDGAVVAEGFYWSSWEDVVGAVTFDRAAHDEALQDAINRTQHLARFYVIDVAEYEDGSWGVVELNDGNMAGLSNCSPVELWANVATALNKR